MARREQLHNSQSVRVRIGRGKLAKATIERVHLCWTTVGTGMITDDSLRSDDDLPMTLDCNHGSANYPRVCVHVRYRNHHRSIVWDFHVSPMNAIDELANLTSESAPSGKRTS
jgi:hypothetical protein